MKYAIYRIPTIQNTIKFSCTVYKLFLNIRNSLTDCEKKLTVNAGCVNNMKKQLTTKPLDAPFW